ncbi:hypothetical protein [Erythrobacter sanguineus]|uniref:Uncharacterized protein n=1 Tax=Erythrobacter sanguineus TaxID=198312 RepID=A0A1M7SIL0_9SPHN|nr:hypothetical protein [Erythrobacter sanguineus]SHN58283.1 hypothetical protein SAMN02745193_01791 [Erythrobacter sanguineus]
MTRKADPRAARLPVPAGELPPFAPVPRQCQRHDGWTPARQCAFIEALADTGSVAAACKAVNMSERGAYHLRRQPGAEEFRHAWDIALDLGVRRVEDVVMDRALNGVQEPLYSYGKLIGTRTRYNDRLLMFILRNRAPDRFGARIDGGSARGLNAVGKMEAERLKQQWRKEWEAEQARVSPQEVRASIDRKIADIRARSEARWQSEWESLSEETRAAWTAFEALRNRDLDAMRADEDLRRRLRFGPKEDVPALRPEDVRRVQPPEPEVAKTRWTLKDENFDP